MASMPLVIMQVVDPITAISGEVLSATAGPDASGEVHTWPNESRIECGAKEKHDLSWLK